MSFREYEKYLESIVRFCAENSSFIFWSLSLEIFLIVRDNYVDMSIKIPNFSFLSGEWVVWDFVSFWVSESDLEWGNHTQNAESSRIDLSFIIKDAPHYLLLLPNHQNTEDVGSFWETDFFFSGEGLQIREREREREIPLSHILHTKK